METGLILKLGIFILSTPFILFAHVAEKCNLWELRSDVQHCLSVLDDYKRHDIPDRLIEALFVAEDRRNLYHFGIDPIGIVRAIWSILRFKGIQGASTVEQQFVRVVTASYERTIRRKLKEQALAIAISKRRKKLQIASAYLCIAHYGHGLNGISGLNAMCGASLTDCADDTIREMVARLKYPQPRRVSTAWNKRISDRADYMKNRIQKKESRILKSSNGQPLQVRHLLKQLTGTAPIQPACRLD